MKQGETAAFFVKRLETRRIQLATDEEACVCAFESKLPQEFLWDVEVLRRSRGAGAEAEWSMFVAVAEDRLSGASITVNESVGAAPAATGVPTAVSYPPLLSSCLQDPQQSQSHPQGALFPLAGALMAPAPSVQNWESNTLIMTQIGAVSTPSPNVSTKIATEVRCAISHRQGFLSLCV